MLKKLFRQRKLKFLFAGGIAAALNLLLIVLFIEWLEFETPVFRNVANVIAVEISLLFSFFAYRLWVWPGGNWTIRDVFWRQIPLYHVSTGTAVILRIFLVFPLLDWLQVHYLVNTLLGVLLSATLNYLFSDTLLFKSSSRTAQQRSDDKGSDLYHPEGLAPALLSTTTRRGMKPGGSTIRDYGKIDRLSIVIPAYNEEGSIAPTVRSISQCLQEKEIVYEILIVNDNSRDRTEEIVRQLTVQNNCIRYINNYYPNGFGFAVRCGLENFQGDAVAIVMADGSDAPENIVDYYHKLQEGYDCVFGSRFITGSKVIDYPIHKLIVNRLANLFVSVLFNLKYNDTTNAFKGYRREVIDGISPLISHHFNLTVEMPLKAVARGYSYTVVPISWQNRATGVSKLKLKEMGSRYLFIVLYIFLEKLLTRGDYVRKHSQLVVPNEVR